MKSSYQKLKEENKRLKQELYIIAEDPNSIEAQGIIYRIKMHSDLVKAVWFGDTRKSEITSQGLYTQLKQSNMEIYRGVTKKEWDDFLNNMRDPSIIEVKNLKDNKDGK